MIHDTEHTISEVYIPSCLANEKNPDKPVKPVSKTCFTFQLPCYHILHDSLSDLRTTIHCQGSSNN